MIPFIGRFFPLWVIWSLTVCFNIYLLPYKGTFHLMLDNQFQKGLVSVLLSLITSLSLPLLSDQEHHAEVFHIPFSHVFVHFEFLPPSCIVLQLLLFYVLLVRK